MSWFKRDSESRKPAAAPDASERTVKTEGLWLKCDGCKEIIWKKDLETTNNVCGKCGYHFRVDARARLALLFDDGVYEELDAELCFIRSARFRRPETYKDRLAAMQAATSLKDALISAYRYSRGTPCEHLRHGAEVHRWQHGLRHG